MKKWLLLALLWSCAGNSKEQELYMQSNLIHLEAIELGQRVTIHLEKIEQKIASNHDAVPQPYQDSLRSIMIDYEGWVRDLIEVPGFEHEGHDHVGHSHHHEATHQLTPEMLLELQMDAKKNIEAIHKRTQQLLLNITE